MSRDNWERLVAAVLKREQLWQLCHQQSRSPSIVSTISSDDFGGQILNFSSNRLKSISASPSHSPPVPLKHPSLSQVGNNAYGPITRKLFSAWNQRRKLKDEYFFDIPGEEDPGIHLILGQFRRFSLHELQVATENFSDKNVFKYGYNVAYKGRLADGFPVAIKRHKESGTQSAEAEFVKEIEINSISAHPNVLHFLGICITATELLLVYPLMVNGSVASCLRGRHESQVPLSWPIRKRIALGAARGLAYLHEKCSQKIILRDINAANMLLDEEFEAIVGNFELAIIMDYNVTHVITSVLEGTIGHIAPEYHASGICSEKTDVFGYGMFLLELVTSRRAFELARLANEKDMVLIDWVKRILEERNWEMLVDPDGGGIHMEDVVEQLLQIALLCIQSTPQRRPKMSEILRMLDVAGYGLAKRWKKWHKKEIFC